MSKHSFAEPSPTFIAIATGLTLVMGIVMVLGYACIRTRLGAGPKTAIIAGLFAWFAVYFYSGIINGVVFGIPMGEIAMVCGWGLVEYALAALAGSWVYKEA